ncbi:MAG TPA: zinc-binding alcohol dehydrogenase family protein [Mycobacteriales bacterium]|nr:zinc-binding alcohol dehydrogenase family protein [Mycobacteriales bacterium]
MRAAVLGAYGAPPEPAERPDPVPGPGQQLVRVTAAPIVPLDLLCATGTSYFGAPPLPYVPGVQGVGTLAGGERVFFSTSAGMKPGDGSLAELAVSGEVVPLADDVPDELVAALGLSAVAAWMSLTWRARVRPGERVLVLGAGGAVGQVAVQAAVALGAGAVVAGSRRMTQRELARSRGATGVVDLSDVDGLTDRIREAAGGPVDVVIDPVGGEAATAALLALAEHGRFVHLGASGGPTATFSSAALRSGSHSILGYTNNALTAAQKAEALGAVLGHRCTVTYETVGLDHVADAWSRAGATPDGRLVVVP